MTPAARVDVAELPAEPTDPAELDVLTRCAVDRSTLPLTSCNAPPPDDVGRNDPDIGRDIERDPNETGKDDAAPAALSARRAPSAALDPAKDLLITVAFVAEPTTGPLVAIPAVRAAEAAAAPLEPAIPLEPEIPLGPETPLKPEMPLEAAVPLEPNELDEPDEATAAVAARDRRI